MWIGGLDTETTGTDVNESRIVQIGIKIINTDTNAVIPYERLINPEVNIPAGAVNLHGIRNADVINERTFAAVAPLLSSLVEKVDLWVMHNGVEFDWPLLLSEFKRAGVSIKATPALFDTMQSGRFATPDGKFPNLGELCWALDVPYDPEKAHGALYDVSVTLDCYLRGRELGVWV